jgi:hypothetical protein
MNPVSIQNVPNNAQNHVVVVLNRVAIHVSTRALVNCHVEHHAIDYRVMNDVWKC